MRRWRNVGLLLFVMAFLAAPFAALAQETTGSISGTVVDPQQNPVPNAKVTLSGGRGDRTTNTDENGRFLLAFVIPGSYKLTIDAATFSPVTDEKVTVGLGQRTIRKYTLAPIVEETVKVSAAAAADQIDVSTQTTGANIPTELAESIPIGRNVQNIVFLAPGVKSGGGTGQANPSISGSSGLENQYVFDGVNVTNQGFGALGSYSIIFGSLGQGINFNFVQETQVLTGGFQAEYGQATGGIVNIITKSGTNEWKGDVFGYWTPTGTQASFSNPDLIANPYAPYQSIERVDYGFDVGGPLVKDHLFLWLGANPTKVIQTRRPPDDSYGLYAAGPDYERELSALNYGAKLSIVPTPDHRIDISAFGDPSESNYTFNRGSTALRQDDKVRFSNLEWGGDNLVLNYNGTVTPNFLIEASIGRATNELSESFPDQYDIWNGADITGLQTGSGASIPLGGLGFYEGLESENDVLEAKFTNIIGNHELSYGFNFERGDFTVTNLRTGPQHTTRDGRTTVAGVQYQRRFAPALIGNPGVEETQLVTDPHELEALGLCDSTITDPLDPDYCPPGGIAVPIIYRINRGDIEGATKDTSTWYNAAFIQDDWAITPDLHLDLGVRWEQQYLEGTEAAYLLPAEWAPRVGISWDHTGEGKSKLYAHYGQFYEKVPLDIAARLFSPDLTITRGEYFDPGMTNPTGSALGTSGNGLTRVEEGTRTSQTDEFVLGYERQVAKKWTLKAEYQYRDLKRALEDVHVGVYYLGADFDGDTVSDCNDTALADRYFGQGDILLGYGQARRWGGAEDARGVWHSCVDFGEFVVANPTQEFGLTPSDGNTSVEPERTYHALLLEATRNAGERGYVNIQYVLSSLRGNYEGNYRNDNGQSDPNLTSLWDFPDDATMWSTFKGGPLNTDRTHRLQAYGFYGWKNGWSLGSRFVLQTGVPKLRLASLPLYGNTGEISLDDRDANGRTPLEYNVDLNFAKKWKFNDKLGSALSVEVDIFNLFNRSVANDFDYEYDSASDDAAIDEATSAEEIADIIANQGVPNPDYDRAISYQNPREVRFGVKWQF